MDYNDDVTLFCWSWDMKLMLIFVRPANSYGDTPSLAPSAKSELLKTVRATLYAVRMLPINSIKAQNA